MLDEIKKVLDDILNGALPPREYIGFVGFLLRKISWVSIAIALGFIAFLLVLANS